MDATTFGIAIGLAVAAIYVVVRLLRQRTFDTTASAVAFLAGFSVPSGASLIAAAWTGRIDVLSDTWREYLAAAGVIAIGLATQYIIESMRAVWARPAQAQASEHATGEAAVESEHTIKRGGT